MGQNKIALVFAGQPRHVRECYEQFLQPNLLDINDDMDVFFHCWYDKADVGKEYDCSDWAKGTASVATEDAIDEICELYKPKAFTVEPQKEFELPREYTFAGDQKQHIPYSMFYSVMESMKLKKQWEEVNDFTYDWVIRCRFDFGLITPIKIDELDSELVHLPNNCQIHPGATPDSYNDMFSLSKSEYADHYGDTFNHIDEYYEDGVKYVQEPILGHHFIKHEIPVEPQPYSFRLVGR